MGPIGATIQFVHLEPDHWHEIDGFRVKAKLQPHHGDSYGYRFEKNGKAIVYSTDGEHKLGRKRKPKLWSTFIAAPIW